MQSNLKENYDLELIWKEKSLVPMIENRKAYLVWIHSLLLLNADKIIENFQSSTTCENGKLLDMY